MTDPLTGKELVQKSYDYVDKLTKECAKVLIEDYSKTHRKFQLGKVSAEISSDIVHWFEKRDSHVHLSYDASSLSRPQPTQFHLKFKGNTKDADFILLATAGLFAAPGTEINDSTVAFPKTLVISADKASFMKKK